MISLFSSPKPTKTKLRKYLFVNPYTKDADRGKEFAYCIEQNKKVFDKVIILDGDKTVTDLVQMANHNNGDINVIANADVWFETTTGLANIQPKEMYALTRYENGAFFCRKDSADAWVFRGSINDKFMESCTFRLGLRGSDNAIAARAQSAGYIVSNPSLDIRINHEHASRTDNNSYAPAPYDMVVRPSTFDGNCLLFLTSINPFARITPQMEAVQSWMSADNRIRVVSVNTRKEIDKLRQYPGLRGVRFVEQEDAVDGKYQKLDTMVATANEINADWYVFINSDIRMEDNAPFLENLETSRPIIGIRTDLKMQGQTSEFPYGYDVFAMRRAHLDYLKNYSTDFAIGLPWWDFYVPLALLQTENYLWVDRTSFTHFWHPTRYSMERWAYISKKCRENTFFVDTEETQDGNFCTANKNYIDNHLKEL